MFGEGGATTPTGRLGRERRSGRRRRASSSTAEKRNRGCEERLRSLILSLSLSRRCSSVRPVRTKQARQSSASARQSQLIVRERRHRTTDEQTTSDDVRKNAAIERKRERERHSLTRENRLSVVYVVYVARRFIYEDFSASAANLFPLLFITLGIVI